MLSYSREYREMTAREIAAEIRRIIDTQYVCAHKSLALDKTYFASPPVFSYRKRGSAVPS
jgi:hypothetical protein